MNVQTAVFLGITAFALILFLLVREAPSLSLLFSSVNSLVASLFGAELIFSAGLFIISFVILFTVSIVSIILLAVKNRKRNVNNTQKNDF